MIMQVKNEGRKNMERELISVIDNAKNNLEANTNAEELETSKLNFYKAVDRHEYDVN